MMVSLNFSPAYPTVQSPTTPGQQSYPGGITDWSRASFIRSPRWQGQSYPAGVGQVHLLFPVHSGKDLRVMHLGFYFGRMH